MISQLLFVADGGTLCLPIANRCEWQTHPTMPRGTPIADRRRAGEARPRGKAGSGRRKACFHPGGSGFHLPRGIRQCRLPVLSAWLLRRTQPSLVLSLYAPRYCLTASAGFGRQFAKLRALSRLRRRYDSRKYRFPRSPRPPRPLTAGSCGCTWQFASFFSCLAASCAARSDSAVSA